MTRMSADSLRRAQIIAIALLPNSGGVSEEEIS